MSTSATPAMRQYQDAKQQYPDAVLFFRMGDFYEMFYEDALLAARALDLTLTSRSRESNGASIPMCGVPFHAADGYIARLVKKGMRVAICDQVEDPKKAKGLVKREVVRVVSPGTLTDAGYLDAREPAFLMALVEAPRRQGDRAVVIGAALLDVSTGEFTTAEYRGDDGLQALRDELHVLRPREAVVAGSSQDEMLRQWPFVGAAGIPLTPLDPWAFDAEAARRTLIDQMRVADLAGFDLEGHPAAVSAAGALVQYLRTTQKADLAHVRSLTYRQRADAVLIDPTTLDHLEVLEGAEGGRAGSLLDELDRTMTAGGSRLLRAWLMRPLLSLDLIRDRLDAVEELAFRAIERGKLREGLKPVQDLERLVARAALGTAGPRDLVGLRQSLSVIPRVRAVLAPVQAPLLGSLIAALDDLADVRDRIEAAIIAERAGAIRSMRSSAFSRLCAWRALLAFARKRSTKPIM
jgi:DNA mismatch repair protein MutS